MTKKKITKITMQYTGSEERMVHLTRKQFTVKKGDTFEVTKKEAKKFETKEEFEEMK